MGNHFSCTGAGRWLLKKPTAAVTRPFASTNHLSQPSGIAVEVAKTPRTTLTKPMVFVRCDQIHLRYFMLLNTFVSKTVVIPVFEPSTPTVIRTERLPPFS